MSQLEKYHDNGVLLFSPNFFVFLHAQGNDAAQDKFDYECENGEGWVKNLVSPVWSPENTDEACSSNQACSSGVCLVTNVTDATLGRKVIHLFSGQRGRGGHL